MEDGDSNFWQDGGIVVIVFIVGITMCFIFAQLRGCEEARYRANVEVGAKSSVSCAPRNEAEIN
jgi:hypothetical protein